MAELNKLKVYVPGASTVGVRVFPPLTIFPFEVVQLYVNVGPDEEALASRMVFNKVQVRISVGSALTVGIFTSAATVTEVLAVQPFRILVTHNS